MKRLIATVLMALGLAFSFTARADVSYLSGNVDLSVFELDTPNIFYNQQNFYPIQHINFNAGDKFVFRGYTEESAPTTWLGFWLGQDTLTMHGNYELPTTPNTQWEFFFEPTTNGVITQLVTNHEYIANFDGLKWNHTNINVLTALDLVTPVTAVNEANGIYLLVLSVLGGLFFSRKKHKATK